MNKVNIRPFRYEDITANYVRWMNDSEVTKFLGAAGSHQTTGEVYDYASGCIGNKDTQFYAIEYEGEHVGNIKLVVQSRHKKGIISLMVGEKSLWGRGIGTEAVRQMVTFAFGPWQLRKLEAGILAPNRGSYCLFRNNGFQVDGFHSMDRYFQGAYVDAIYMSLFNKDF